MKKLTSLLLAFLFMITAYAQTTVWKFDPSHSQIQFTVTHLVISEVTGNFRKFDGEVKSDGTDFSKAQIRFSIESKSIFTDNDKRDEHLRSDDFFNSAKFPQITFVSKYLTKTGNNKYKLIGDLTIRDVTKQVALEVTQTGVVNAWGQEKAGFKIKGTINRFDFGLKWNSLIETGGAVVGEDVDIICNIQLVKQAS